MIENLNISIPILFNAFKHHKNFILSVLKTASSNQLIDLLTPLCNNYIDIYTGEVSPEEIAHSILIQLQIQNALSLPNFEIWLSHQKGYQIIKLRDQSEWIIRKSNNNVRYIHIHPARTGLHTLRFKGSTLKTAFQLKLQNPNADEHSNLALINKVRIQIGLSPIKRLEKGKGILKCFSQFFNATK